MKRKETLLVTISTIKFNKHFKMVMKTSANGKDYLYTE